MSKQRKPLVAANWKMNHPPEGWNAPDSPYRRQKEIDVWVFPPSLFIMHCLSEKLIVGAQHARPETKGAFTGDIGVQMLKDVGCTAVLCGHSERRRGHGESDDFVAAQVRAAIMVGLQPIACIGETLAERDAGDEKKAVERQLKPILNALQSNIPSERAGLVGPARAGHHKGKGESVRGKPLGCPLALAYEPVWAIGTGNNATPEQAKDMHAFIRSLLPKPLQQSTHILYGGSIKPENAEELFSQPDIDGGLVGGASLDPKAFRAIIEAVESPSRK